MTTIDIYARVSQDADLNFKSTDDQVLDCRDRITELGHEVGEVFVDNSKSAWNPKIKRPEWERLMVKIESGLSQGLIVFDMARFSRRPLDGERLIAAAERGLIVLDSESGYDLTSGNGKKTFRDHLSAAAYESDRTQSRTRRGKRRKIEKGLTNHAHRPFGFEQDGHTLRVDEVKVLRSMYDALLEGESINAIARELNRAEIRTSIGRTWNHSGVREMLLRARNVGLIESRGVIVGTLRGADIETVVSPEVYERARTVLGSRRRGRPNSDLYLGSRILVCGLCGADLYGAPITTYYPDGERRRRYCCKGAYGCNRISVDWRSTDALIEEIVLDLLTGQRVETVRRQVADEHAETRRSLLAQIEEAEVTAEAMAERLGLDQIKLAAFEAFMARHQPRVAALRETLAALPAPPVMDETFAEMTAAELLARWQDPAATAEERRRLVKEALAGQVIVVAPVAKPGGRFELERLSVAARPPFVPRVRSVS